MESIEGIVENSLEEAEEIEHMSQSRRDNGTEEKWEMAIPLFTSLVAVLATVAALFAAFASDKYAESMYHEVMEYGRYQNDITRFEVLKNRREMLLSVGKDFNPEDMKRMQDLEKVNPVEVPMVAALEQKAKLFDKAHHVLAISITCFQFAIALSAVSMTSRRRTMWYVAWAFMLFGGALGAWGGVLYSSMN